MSNPIFSMMQNQAPMNGIMQRLQQFQRMIQGDPKQQVQQLLNSGRISQAQYNQAVNLTNQLQKIRYFSVLRRYPFSNQQPPDLVGRYS